MSVVLLCWRRGGAPLTLVVSRRVKGLGIRFVAYFDLSICRTEPERLMGDVKAIEKAVEAPPPAELAEFRRWFAEYDGAAWDKQIEEDAARGKLDSLAAEALADHRSGSHREP